MRRREIEAAGGLKSMPKCGGENRKGEREGGCRRRWAGLRTGVLGRESARVEKEGGGEGKMALGPRGKREMRQPRRGLKGLNIFQRKKVIRKVFRKAQQEPKIK